jgi:hypothetical protein
MNGMSPSSCDGENWGSNFGAGLDVMAPGVLISTTDRQGNLGYNPNVAIHRLSGGTLVANDFGDQNYTIWFNGTSAAAPQVAGIAALILSINPNLTLQQVRNIIESTTDKIGGVTYTLNAGEQAGLTWNNQMGYGRVNALRAVQAALQTVNISGPALVCTNGTFTLNNPPAGAVTWSVTPSHIVSPSNGTGPVANVTRVSNGSAVITFNSACANINRSLNFHAGPYSSSHYPINGPSSTTCNSDVFYSIPTLAGVTSITWVWPSGWTYISGQNTTHLALRTNSSGGTVAVGVNNTCGQSGSFATRFTSVTGFCGFQTFSAYPNPASGELTISFGDTTATDAMANAMQEFEAPYQVKLFNQYQELIYSAQSNRNTHTISTSNFPSGMYYLNIVNKEGVIQRKIWVNRTQ